MTPKYDAPASTCAPVLSFPSNVFSLRPYVWDPADASTKQIVEMTGNEAALCVCHAYFAAAGELFLVRSGIKHVHTVILPNTAPLNMVILPITLI